MQQSKIACFLNSKHVPLQAFAEACTRFSPHVAIRDQEAVFIDFTKTQNLFSDAGLKLRLEALARKFGFQNFRVAIAGSASQALVQARFGSSDAIEQVFDLTHPFERNSEKEKQLLKLIEILAKLGVKTLSEFLKIPPQTLASHLGLLGEEALKLAQIARGEIQAAWPGFHPLPIIAEKIEVADVNTSGRACSPTFIEMGDVNLDSLLFILRGTVDRALSRLRGRCERASQVQVQLQLDRWSTLKIHERKWIITLPLPQGSSQSLLPILRERLSYELQKLPLEAPVQSLQFEILESVPGNGAQRDFFNKKEEQEEAWSALIGRLGEKLGVSHVFVAVPVENYLPEKSYERKLEAREISTHFFSALPERPTRILPEPEPLLIHGKDLSAKSGKRWRVKFSKGPERIKTESWKPAPVTRDYFQIMADTGEKLWIYMNQKTFFLHGYFD